MKTLKLFFVSAILLLTTTVNFAQVGGPSNSETVQVNLEAGYNSFVLPQSGATVIILADALINPVGGEVRAHGSVNKVELKSSSSGTYVLESTPTTAAGRTRVIILVTDGMPSATAEGRQKNRRVEMEVVFE